MSTNSSSPTIRVSPQLVAAAAINTLEVLTLLGTSGDGLSEAEAAAGLKKYGPNEAHGEAHETLLGRLWNALRNPLVILLSILAFVSAATGDLRAASVMGLMVVLGLALRFVQESKADAAAAKLHAMIKVTATVVREGEAREIPLRDLVPGDIVQLAAGDMIPGDIRLLSAKDLFIIQASLTGEAIPVEKTSTVEKTEGKSPLELQNVCFLGTSVDSGSATAVVVSTGANTYFGSMAGSITAREPETSFDRGINRFTWLMLRFMFVMVPLVFLINGLTKHDWKEAFFFSLAVAVGLTPEMLPMIVSVCLSKGALAMSGKKVIVKRLSSIQNFGAMDVLCSDKTGTLTQDKVILEKHCDVALEEDDTVLHMAYLISHFQTGLKNVLDRAILDHKDLHVHLSIDDSKKVDEIPFDFNRRIMSVVIETPDGKHQLLTKGAPEEVFKRCNRFELEGDVFPLDPMFLFDLKEEYERLNADGFRVLAVAYKDLEHRSIASKSDETELVLKGYVSFLDPPKDSARPAIEADLTSPN